VYIITAHASLLTACEFLIFLDLQLPIYFPQRFFFVIVHDFEDVSFGHTPNPTVLFPYTSSSILFLVDLSQFFLAPFEIGRLHRASESVQLLWRELYWLFLFWCPIAVVGFFYFLNLEVEMVWHPIPAADFFYRQYLEVELIYRIPGASFFCPQHLRVVWLTLAVDVAAGIVGGGAAGVAVDAAGVVVAVAAVVVVVVVGAVVDGDGAGVKSDLWFCGEHV